jgi:hypothetical protein
VNMTEDYEGLGFYTCIIKKNVSVLKHIKESLLAPAIVIAIVIVVIGLLVIICQNAYPILNNFIPVVVAFGTENPIACIISLVFLSFEAYCIAWCVRIRRQKFKEIMELSTPMCPIENRKNKEG